MSFRTLRRAALLVALCLPGLLPAQAPDPNLNPAPQVNNPLWAVVRIPSHGVSATVIETRKDYSLLLGCAHGHEGADRNKPMVVDVPGGPQPGRRVNIRLAYIDYQADVTLIEMDFGPLPHACPVAPQPLDLRGRDLLSAGYDNMTWPATVKGAEFVESQGNWTYTRQRPWHGRSGGALIDAQSGTLVGVVHGYFVAPGGYGIYVRHESILAALRKFKSGEMAAPPTMRPGRPPSVTEIRERGPPPAVIERRQFFRPPQQQPFCPT